MKQSNNLGGNVRTTNAKASGRPWWFVMLGVVLLVAMGGLLFDAHQRSASETANLPSTYEYRIDQTVDAQTNYFKSSFYEDGPGPTNTAYVADLTDTVTTKLRYHFKATKPTELTTMYSVTAVVKEKFSAGADGKDISNVWSKEYPLLKPVMQTTTSTDVSFEPAVEVPFAEYRKIVEQIRTSLALPATSEVVVTFTVRVAGTVDNTPFDDIRVSTVTMPLDQPIYKFATKFEKEATKQVVAQSAKNSRASMALYERIAAAVAGVLAACAIGFGMRKQMFKSPYQRELDKIYRYHNGLIIKAGPQADLTHKTTVPVESFDDILNLEEELKSPIVASPAGGSATRFMIIHGDIVYVYILGKIEKSEATTGRSLEEIEAFIEGSKAAGTAKKIEVKSPGHRTHRS